MSTDTASASQEDNAAPLPNTSFDVAFDGLARLGFSSVEGIEAALEAPVPEPAARRTTPAPRKERPATLVLRRGATGGKELWDWYAAVRQGRDARRNGTIVIRSTAGRPVLRIALSNAQPCRWRLGRLDALQPEVLVEEIELIVETLDLALP